MNKRKLFIEMFFTLMILMCNCLVFSQPEINIPKVIPASANAASLGVYGQIPVSLFNGLPQISIPLGNVVAGEVGIPISLNYHGGGIRPDHHGSWVGLGWDLNAGGVITRKVNGAVDEFLTNGETPLTKYGEYYNYAKADTNTWSSQASLYLYTYSFGPRPAYPAPDEFIFNFGQYSGSFFYNQKGKWQVKSSDPINLIIKEELEDDYNLAKQPFKRSDIKLKRIFYRFTIVTPDGCKYVFGGTPESIEFTRNAAYGPDPFNANVVPTSWYLTKVVTRKLQEINFTYQRDGITAQVSSNLLRYHYELSTAPAEDKMHIGNKSASIINTCYLYSIEAPNQKIKFIRSYSNELVYEYEGLLEAARTYEDLTINESSNEVKNDIKWLKLDSILFYSDTSTLLGKFAFSYNQNPSTRLFLDSLNEIGNGGTAKPPFRFKYDLTPLPPYNSQKLDHWGFYNGDNYFLTHVKSPAAYIDSDVPTYYNTRNPNVNYLKAGVLTSVRYPTGGITNYFYEQNEYRKITKRFPFIVTDTSVNVKSSGLRIGKIESTDAFGKVLTSKEYLYLNDFNIGGTLSSGILAGYPQYLERGYFTYPAGYLSYWYWFDFSIEPLSFTDGNHITYTQVVEKFPDGSYAINNYSNHDQVSYRDEYPVDTLYTAPLQSKLDPTTSRSLERGKLLSRRDFSASSLLLKKVKYDYDTSNVRYAENVRIVGVTSRRFGNIFDDRATAYLIYTFPRFVLKETDSLWDPLGHLTVNVKNYRYNNYRLKSVDSTINSALQIEKSTYLYPFDMLPSGDPTGVYQKMVDSNFIAPVIEQRDFVNTVQTKYIKSNYYRPYPWIFAPETVQVQDKANPIETRLRFYNYDTKGNILSVSKEGDSRGSYFWNYKQSLPIAEVKNANPEDIAYTSFESDSTGNWSYSGTILPGTPTGIPSGKKYYTLSLSPLSKSGLSSSVIYIVSYWKQGGGGAFSVAGTIGSATTGRSSSGWTYYEHRVTGQSTITLSGTGSVDEVRLYPANAQMSTYTYDPIIGRTSEVDVNNRITHYEYDQFQRLYLIRDQNRDIRKKFQYEYAGPTIYYNDVRSGVFPRTNCGCLVGSNVPYTIADSTYTSTEDQATANKIAEDSLKAKGERNANLVGTCSAPGSALVTGKNYSSNTYEVRFIDSCTHVAYDFTILAASPTPVNISLSVPAGTYNVEFERVGGLAALNIYLAGFTYSASPSIFHHTFLEVHIKTTGNTLTIN